MHDPNNNEQVNRLPLDAAHWDVVALEALNLRCIVGIHPDERIQPQPLEVAVKLFLPRRPGRFGESLEDSVDYGFVAGDIRFLLEHGRFRLLETAAEAVCSTILGPPAPDRPACRPSAMEVTLRKPLALGGAALPVISIVRWADECVYGVEHNAFGRVDVLHESDDCGVYRLRISPGDEIPPHHHDIMAEAELIMSDGLLLQGQAVGAGLGHVWPKGFVHAYRNSTAEERSILCINRPRFIPSDEVLDAPDAPLAPVYDFRKRYFGLPQPEDFPTPR